MTQAWFNLRVRPADPGPPELELEEGQVWVELDAETVVDGFDQDGVATIDAGVEIHVIGRLCEGELAGPLADRIRPR